MPEGNRIFDLESPLTFASLGQIAGNLKISVGFIAVLQTGRSGGSS